jgi:DNA-binding response OmpR family regulator
VRLLIVDSDQEAARLLATRLRDERFGEGVSRSRLTQGVRTGDVESLCSALDVHVHNLRRKLDVAGGAPLIRTIRGCGYAVGHPEP